MITRSPSNIALVKYMGKEDPAKNIPSNSSLSMTLNSLETIVEVEKRPSLDDFYMEYIPEKPRVEMELQVPDLNEVAVQRMVRHSETVVRECKEVFESFGLSHSHKVRIRVRTGNTFPQSTGIASSASSFSALTLAVVGALGKEEQIRKVINDLSFRVKLAKISRLGSGSSCRSLLGPWVFWKQKDVEPIETALPPLTDLVLLVSDRPKSVGSSEAHLRVKTSPLWEGRAGRAERRCQDLAKFVRRGDVNAISSLAWEESMEMHSLFHTCSNSFTYWEKETIEILRWFWGWPEKIRPIVTMDAGPNLHVLVPTDQRQFWQKKLSERFPTLKMLIDQQGKGTSFL